MRDNLYFLALAFDYWMKFLDGGFVGKESYHWFDRTREDAISAAEQFEAMARGLA